MGAKFEKHHYNKTEYKAAWKVIWLVFGFSPRDISEEIFPPSDNNYSNLWYSDIIIMQCTLTDFLIKMVY